MVRIQWMRPALMGAVSLWFIYLRQMPTWMSLRWRWSFVCVASHVFVLFLWLESVRWACVDLSCDGVTGILLPRIQVSSRSALLRDMTERLAEHVYTHPYHLPSVVVSMTEKRKACPASFLRQQLHLSSPTPTVEECTTRLYACRIAVLPSFGWFPWIQRFESIR
jgi:hypothetical protein